MKKIQYLVLFLTIIIPNILIAQDSCKIFQERDEFTKEIKLTTQFIPLTGMKLNIEATKQEIDFLFSLDGVNNCFDDNSEITINFEGKHIKANLRGASSINCEGLFHLIFKNTATTSYNLNRICTQKITSFVFSPNGKKEIQFQLSLANQMAINKIATCLVAQAKALNTP